MEEPNKIKYDPNLVNLCEFYKVSENGGTFVTAVFYNPNTNEYFETLVRDYDYADGSRDKDDLYYKPISENAKRKWIHAWGSVLVGDTVEVFKGRKVKIGTIAKIVQIKPYYDPYCSWKRWLCDYAYLDNGQKTNVLNCRLVED